MYSLHFGICPGRVVNNLFHTFERGNNFIFHLLVISRSKKIDRYLHQEPSPAEISSQEETAFKILLERSRGQITLTYSTSRQATLVK